MAVDTSAVILLSNFKIAEAISSTPVSPILAFASILIGFKNFFPQDTLQLIEKMKLDIILHLKLRLQLNFY